MAEQEPPGSRRGRSLSRNSRIMTPVDLEGKTHQRKATSSHRVSSATQRNKAAVLDRAFKEVQLTFSNNPSTQASSEYTAIKEEAENAAHKVKEPSTQASSEYTATKVEAENSAHKIKGSSTQACNEDRPSAVKEESGSSKEKLEKKTTQVCGEYTARTEKAEEILHAPKESKIKARNDRSAACIAENVEAVHDKASDTKVKGEGKIKGKREKKRKKADDDVQVEENDNLSDRSETGMTKKNDVKKETKTKKNKESKAVEQEEVEAVDQTAEDEGSTNTKKKKKLPCLFGFISTWLAKRKQKRRNKKKKAIAARNSPSNELADHKARKGGEAFTVEIDSRACDTRTPHLSTVKQRSEQFQINNERYDNAATRRAEQLEKKKGIVRDYEKKKAKCKAKKFEKEIAFRHKADLNIWIKQSVAERNRETQSRCKSRAKASSCQPARSPSPVESFWSIHGPSCFDSDDEDYYARALNADDEFQDEALNLADDFYDQDIGVGSGAGLPGN